MMSFQNLPLIQRLCKATSIAVHQHHDNSEPVSSEPQHRAMDCGGWNLVLEPFLTFYSWDEMVSGPVDSCMASAVWHPLEFKSCGANSGFMNYQRRELGLVLATGIKEGSILYTQHSPRFSRKTCGRMRSLMSSVEPGTSVNNTLIMHTSLDFDEYL